LAELTTRLDKVLVKLDELIGWSASVTVWTRGCLVALTVGLVLTAFLVGRRARR
jgi:hypothetical protein